MKSELDEKAVHARLHDLTREHAAAAARVDEYARRRYLTPGEQLEMKALQRIKLMKKDAIAALERDLERRR